MCKNVMIFNDYYRVLNGEPQRDKICLRLIQYHPSPRSCSTYISASVRPRHCFTGLSIRGLAADVVVVDVADVSAVTGVVGAAGRHNFCDAIGESGSPALSITSRSTRTMSEAPVTDLHTWSPLSFWQ